MIGRNRVKHLLAQTEALAQRAERMEPAERAVNDDPEHLGRVLAILGDVGALHDRPDVLALLDQEHAAALTAAAFAEDPAEREAAQQRLADIERLLPGRHSLTPTDLVAAEQMLRDAQTGVSDNRIPPEDESP